MHVYHENLAPVVFTEGARSHKALAFQRVDGLPGTEALIGHEDGKVLVCLQSLSQYLRQKKLRGIVDGLALSPVVLMGKEPCD